MTEKEILKGCKNNDRKCQKALVDRYSSYLYRVILRYVKDHEGTKDVLQISWIKIFQNLMQYSATGAFQGWIRRIAINESLDYIRKKTKWLDYDEITETDIKEYSSAIGLENLLEEEIINLIKDLPDHYRIVFVMYVVDGFSHDEIAEVLKIKQSSSRSRLMRAREKLRELYLTKFQICVL